MSDADRAIDPSGGQFLLNLRKFYFLAGFVYCRLRSFCFDLLAGARCRCVQTSSHCFHCDTGMQPCHHANHLPLWVFTAPRGRHLRIIGF